jgi:hemerythrin-like metal-binding protein
MARLDWTTHSVFVPKVDDDHEEILAALAGLQGVLAEHESGVERNKSAERLVRCFCEHFRSEERLMKAARYSSLEWHKNQHDHVRKRLRQLLATVRSRDAKATATITSYLNSWLHDHVRVADMMMGAFLRNQRRIGKITFRASTRPIDGCGWKDSNGDPWTPSGGGACR